MKLALAERDMPRGARIDQVARAPGIRSIPAEDERVIGEGGWRARRTGKEIKRLDPGRAKPVAQRPAFVTLGGIAQASREAARAEPAPPARRDGWRSALGTTVLAAHVHHALARGWIAWSSWNEGRCGYWVETAAGRLQP